MIWKIILTILILTSIVGGSASLYFYLNPRTIIEADNKYTNEYRSTKNAIDLEFEKIKSIEKKAKDINQLEIGGWIPEWGISNGINSVFLRDGLFSNISPIWFFLNADGTLKLTSQTNGPNQIKFFRDNNIELIPSIQEFDSENLSKVLNGPGNIDKLVAQILEQAIKNDYAGIDLDIEAIQLDDKLLFFEFLEKLSNELHDEGKKLVFTALPEWSDNFVFGSFPQTSRVQEYERIAELSDEFRIMSYEFSGPTSVKAGPVQPLEWQEQIIQYAIYKGVPREKIVLGIATYSYDWSEREVLQTINLKGDAVFNGAEDIQLENGVALSNKNINKIKSEYEYSEEFNEAWGEMVMKYNFKGQERIVIYPNDRSIEMRKKLAADYGIKGVIYWRLGDEGDLKL